MLKSFTVLASLILTLASTNVRALPSEAGKRPELRGDDFSLEPQDIDLAALFTELRSVDPRYVHGGELRHQIADPRNGDRLIAVDVRLVWQRTDAPRNFRPHLDSSGGVLLLRLGQEGALKHEAYLGLEPDGPPVAESKHPLPNVPTPARALETAGLHLRPAGEILLQTRLARPGVPERPEDQLSFRLSPTLETIAIAGQSELFACGYLGNNSLVSVDPLPRTDLDGSPPDLFALDTCNVNIAPINGDFGIEGSFLTDLPPQAITIHVDLTFYDGNSAQVDFRLKTNSGDWVSVAMRSPDSSGKIQDSIDVPNPTGYVHESNRVFLRLVVIRPEAPALSDGLTADPREDIDIDVLQLETDP